MKKIFPLLLVVMLTQMGFSCEKTEDEPDPTANAKKTIVWDSQGLAEVRRQGNVLPNVDSLYIRVKNKEGVLSFSIDFKGIGKYVLPTSGTASFYLLHQPAAVTFPYAVPHDNIRLPYYLDHKDTQSEVVVTEWNPVSKKIRGTFQCLVAKTDHPAYDHQGTAETLRFTAGSFEGTVIDM